VKGVRGQLEFSAGDLIVLDKNSSGETLEVTGGGHGTCQRTGLSGDVSGGLFYIIPIIDAPSESLLVGLACSTVLLALFFLNFERNVAT
jgi:hypothetical protein